MNLLPGQQPLVWTAQHGYWLRRTGIEIQTCLGKQVIAVQTSKGIAVLRTFTEADKANEAWTEKGASNDTEVPSPTMEVKVAYDLVIVGERHSW